MRPVAPDYPLRTERLLLRPFEDGDLDAVFAIESREDVARFLYNEPRSRAESAERLGRYKANTALSDDGDFLDLAIVLTETDTLVGKSFLARSCGSRCSRTNTARRLLRDRAF